MDPLEDSGDKAPQGFLLFSRVKAGQEVDQKDKSGKMEPLSDVEQEVDDERESNQDSDIDIEVSIQKKLRESQNSEIV